MDKELIAALHRLNHNMDTESLCYELGFVDLIEANEEKKAQEEWEETLGVLHSIWMNLRKQIGVSENKSLPLNDVVESALEELKEIQAPEEYKKIDNSIYGEGSFNIKIDLILEISSILADFQEMNSQEEEEESLEPSQTEWTQGIKSNTVPIKIKHIRYEIKDGDLDLNPRWQRTVVWSLAKKRELIRSLLLGIPLPSLIIYKELPSSSDESEQQYVLDGKQRLTAITEFIAGAWTLGKMSSSALIMPGNFRLSECSERAWGAIPLKAKEKILNTSLVKLILEGLSNTELYHIFELYNTQGMKLNAAEIRNAAYHDNPLHRMIFDLAGEGEFVKDLIGDEKKLQKFQRSLRSTVGGGKEPKRYAAMDILERFLGFSRAPAVPGGSPKVSTTNCIKNYYDLVSIHEDPKLVSKEIVECWLLASELFIDSDNRTTAFSALTSGKNMRFNRLRATTSLIVAKLLNPLIEKSKLTKEDAKKVVSELDSLEECKLPDKQQTGIIWEYQAKVVSQLLFLLEDYECNKYLIEQDKEFIQKMHDLDISFDFF